MKGFSLSELLQQHAGAIPLTHRALKIIQAAHGGRQRAQHGVAKVVDEQFADGRFRVVLYWVILNSGVMQHSFLHLRKLTSTGGLQRLPKPWAVPDSAKEQGK